MAVSTTDGRAKAVYNQIVDKVSAMHPLYTLSQDMGEPLKLGESIDIVTRAAVSIEDAANGASMSVQSISPVANNLIVDQHKGAIVGIPKLARIQNMEGAWAGQLARQILTELGVYMGQDFMDELIRVGAYSSSAAYTANVAGDALSVADTETAMAIMTDQSGVNEQDCVWIFGPYGAGSLRTVSAFTPNESSALGALGIPTIGTLHGIPVVRSQSVPKSLAVATTAVSVTSNVATATVASGHGFVPGMVISTTGHTTNATNATISSVTATTIVYPLTASDGALADGVGTITCSRTFNGLLHLPWAFRAVQQVPDLQIVPASGKIQDELQADAIWGFKALSGSFVSLLSPATSVT